ncbi:MAG: DUF177 domain-containing protein [Actinomycetota bacterium]
MSAKRNRNIPEGLRIDLSGVVVNVGDHTRARGSASLEFSDIYQAEFVRGDDISWNFELRRITGGVQATGDINGEVPLSCYRCLEEFRHPISVKVDEVVLTVATGQREPGDLDDEYMVLDEQLDLEPILRDAVYLAIPVRRICSEECRGICPTCGENRNLVECGCPAREPDARLKPLADLKRRLEGR